MDGLPSLETVASDLETAGFAVQPRFLEVNLGQELLAEARQLREKGAFKQEEVGRGQNRQLRGGWRTDQICWLDPLALSPPQRAYWSRMEELRVALNRQLFLVLVQLEGGPPGPLCTGRILQAPPRPAPGDQLAHPQHGHLSR